MRYEVNWLLPQLSPRFSIEARESSVVDVHNVELVEAQPLGDKLAGELFESLVRHQTIDF